MTVSYELRKAILAADFAPTVKEAFQNKPQFQSAMLLVAQYWADEADDACHTMMLFSNRQTPLWPHICPGYDDELEENEDEGCENCTGGSSMPFDDNGDGIPAFASCCREDGSQEEEMYESYVPYLIARRRAPGTFDLDIEYVGGPLRGWAEMLPRGWERETDELHELVYASPDDDAPRQVLSDRLLQQGDPRGQYIALAFAKPEDPKLAELEELHRTRWLGVLARIAMPEQTRFKRGFPSELTVFIPKDNLLIERIKEAPEWGTIEKLRFLPQSEIVFSPKMTALREVGPVPAKHLGALPESVEVLHIPDDVPPPSDLPPLKTLILDANQRYANDAIDELVVTALTETAVSSWLGRKDLPRRLTFQSLAPGGQPAGFRLSISFADNLATIDMPSLNAAVGFRQVAEIATNLRRRMNVQVRRTRYWEPTDTEKEALGI